MSLLRTVSCSSGYSGQASAECATDGGTFTFTGCQKQKLQEESDDALLIVLIVGAIVAAVGGIAYVQGISNKVDADGLPLSPPDSPRKADTPNIDFQNAQVVDA